MIHSLTIKNIQSHKNSFLEFDPGVNIVVGGSDNGKSAIFNALYWNMYNRPLGEEHRSWESLGWEGPMSSEIELQEGITIKLERDKQTIYTIDPGNGDTPVEFKAFGQEPPKEITQIFNINRKINIQQQLEKGVPIFLISESPGDVAKHFNSVAGLYKIDTTIDKGKKEVNQANKELKIIKNQIKDKEDEEKTYTGLEEFNLLVESALKLEQEINEQKILKDKLKNTLTKIEDINKSLITKKLKLNLKDQIKDGLLLYNRIKEQKIWITNMNKKLLGIKDKEDQLKILNKKLKLKPLIDSAFMYSKMKTEYNSKKNKLDGTLNLILKTKEGIQKLILRKEKIKIKFEELMPEQCPLCNSIRS